MVLTKAIIFRAKGRAQLIWVAGNVPETQVARVTLVEPLASIFVLAVVELEKGTVSSSALWKRFVGTEGTQL
jgi:hypothetical protein